MHFAEQTVMASLLRHDEIGGLFEFLGDIQFWVKDAGGCYLRVNRAFQLNYSLASVEDVKGLTDFDLSPPWLAEQFVADDKRVLLGDRIVNRIELVGGFDQTTRWCRTSKIPIHDAAGNIAATAGINQLLPDLKTPDFPLPELAAALAAIQKSPEKSWRNTELAALVGLSVSAFERRFRKHLHTSPMQFLKRVRLARSAAALVQTNQSISEIAFENGFSDQAHLSREFKRLFQATPSEWRTRYLSGE